MAFKDSNYEGPKDTASSYLDYKDVGKHQFRFMGDVEAYNRYWKDKKPYRYVNEDEVPDDIDYSDKYKKKQKEHVWAVVAIKREGKGNTIGILTITQATVQKQLMSLYHDADYGDFCDYDIVIEKIEGAKVSYQVTPKPPKPTSKEDLELYETFEPKDLSKKDMPDDPSRMTNKMVEDVSSIELPF